MIKSLFCCCASRYTYDSDEEDGVETTEVVVNVNLCKAGPASDGLSVVEKDEGGVYSASGKGVIIGSCALECDTAYWEVVIGAEPSSVAIGVIRFDPKKEEKPASLSKDKWVLETKEPLKQGDVVGVHWDQTDLPMLTFAVNGERVSSCINRIRPSNNVYAAVEVRSTAGGADLVFDGRHFKHTPWASKFGAIVCATSIL